MSKDYYNELAPYYRYIYQDWDKSVAKQAGDLDSIIKEFFGKKKDLLDVSCGIGTQSIGLAELGYRVSASDISAVEIRLARKEARKRKLKVDFKISDMRKASKAFRGSFDVVLSADNSIPHLLRDIDIARAFKEFHALLKPGGGCIISVRDYRNINKEKQKELLNFRQTHDAPEGRIILFDLWQFDGHYYDLNTYLVKDSGKNQLKTLAMRSRYYCVTTDQLKKLLKKAGFVNIQILKDRFFQEVLIAFKDDPND